jgi:hypothetical protein
VAAVVAVSGLFSAPAANKLSINSGTIIGSCFVCALSEYQLDRLAINELNTLL